jgi:hypothetical protein
MMKQGTPFLRNFVFACFMHAPSLDVIYCLVLALFLVKTDVIKYMLQNLIMSDW